MKLIFVSSGQYPDGGAASNRHLAYAKGLVELGHKIVFILLKEQESKDIDLIEDGIKFICVAEKRKNKLSRIKKFQSFFNVISKAKQVINSMLKEDKTSSLVLLDTSISILIPLINKAKKSGMKVFHERSEYPFIYGGKTILGKLDLYIYLKYVLQRFDGIYVINNALKKYFADWTKNKIEVIVINMIVDPARFEIKKTTNITALKTITYCGSLEIDKDGIPVLIEAFSLLANEFPYVSLQLIGSSGSQTAKQDLLLLVQKLGIENRVRIIGPYKRDEIPKILTDSDILVLSRPNNKQAEGGFPTKLGEYLATGNPVVITNVGEIDRFLKDGLNAFIAEPDNIGEFSNKLREALLSPKADSIGQEGRKLVYKEFNYLYQAKILEKFFEK